MSVELPAPKFQHFERVVIKGERPRCKDFQDERGTIIWLDSSVLQKNSAQPDKWLYIVHLPGKCVWRTFFQSDLESEGSFDPESAHLGKRPEISFDLVLQEDHSFMEGSYRLPDEFWKVVIFKKDDVEELQFQTGRCGQRPTKWERQISGMWIRIPRVAKVDRDYLIQAITQATGYDGWVEVRGPDSIVLR
jgi:hypothetical protein